MYGPLALSSPKLWEISDFQAKSVLIFSHWILFHVSFFLQIRMLEKGVFNPGITESEQAGREKKASS